jgi:hypothetical protein
MSFISIANTFAFYFLIYNLLVKNAVADITNISKSMKYKLDCVNK